MYKKENDGSEHYKNPTKYLLDYLSIQGVNLSSHPFIPPEQELKESVESEVNTNI